MMAGADQFNDQNDISPFSDNEWVAGVTARNKVMIAMLYDRYAPALYGYILKTVKTEEPAATILAAAFIEIINGIDGFAHSDVRFFTWMLRITHWEMVKHVNGARVLDAPVA